MLICYIYCEDQPGVRGAYFFPLIYWIMHRISIALKYASLSDTEYKRYFECTSIELMKEYRDQMQIFTGWSVLNTKVAQFELGAASIRVGRYQ